MHSQNVRLFLSSRIRLWMVVLLLTPPTFTDATALLKPVPTAPFMDTSPTPAELSSPTSESLRTVRP